MTLTQVWKYLPIGSWLYTNDHPQKNSLLRLVEIFSHTLYAIVPPALIATYIMGVGISGKLNPVALWETKQAHEILETRAYQLADTDGISGLSLAELDDLYRRTGIELRNVLPGRYLPSLTKKTFGNRYRTSKMLKLSLAVN